MTERATRSVSCPFCGAPFRKFIPANTMQLECQYCGGVFLVPPELGTEIPQCANHPDKFALGLCNDCGDNFCGDCLHVYKLVTRDASAVLHLCSNCLKGRYSKDGNGFILTGVMSIVMGLVASTFVMPMGLSFVVLGVVAIGYGFVKRSGMPEEPTINAVRNVEERRRAEAAELGGADPEDLYDELVTCYTSHWGVATGAKLLDDEISAYLRHRESFPEAVRKIYNRQRGTPSDV